VNQGKSSTESRPTGAFESHTFVLGLWGVRYQVKDVSRSVAFYTERLGFKLDQQHLPAFAQVSIGNLKLILSGPGASGSRPMPDGRQQEPGGWNRVILQVNDLAGRIESLDLSGVGDIVECAELCLNAFRCALGFGMKTPIWSGSPE
jgi:glyoxylase I family protein